MDDDEESLCPFGTPLEPLEEDEIPSKKPISIEDQVVTDSSGRRRFHGAFTGGFSAGFWNTVGSLEGWKPQNFKSSRTEKAKQLDQKPIDFMDDEDLGEFGIAPQRVQTTEDFTPQDRKPDSRKRKLQQQIFGPIPGTPVLHQILQPAKENVAIRLLKKMGWKIGQGIGARQTRKEKKAATKRSEREKYVMKKYGCDLGPLSEQKISKNFDSDDDDDNDSDEEEITFAPDDFDPYVCAIKDNTFGLGYSGLNPNSLSDKPLQHVNLFENAFEIMGKNNKKLSIRGQAFGVGALEEDDEDIYAPDDMTNYDFSLGDNKKLKTKKRDKKDETFIEGFCSSEKESIKNKKVFIVTLPPEFKPRNWAIRKSRFEPLSEERKQLLMQKTEYKTKGLGRHDLNPEKRGSILGESVIKEKESIKKDEIQTDKNKSYLKKLNEKYESEGNKNLQTGKTIESNTENLTDNEIRKENEKIQNEAKKITEKLLSKSSITTFKPFLADEAKQERYEKFLETNLIDDYEITKFLTSIQPLSMSEWDREMEKKEFLQARNIYKPLKGIMSDRFVSETTVLAERESEQTKVSTLTEEKIEIKRTKTTWKPSSQLCKRFNVPEPFGGAIVEEKKEKKPRFSVFDYLESSINKKENFQTPVIIPKIIEKPKPIISQENTQNTDGKDRIKIEIDNVMSSDIVSSNLMTSNFVKDMNNSSHSKLAIDEENKDINKNTSNKLIESENLRKNDSKDKIKPKTELEKKIEETKNKHPSEKKDLFKSIFESSDDDDDDDDDNVETKEKLELNSQNKKVEKNNEISSLELSSSSNISKDIYATLTKSATEINILRNTSPPRGIFANLFTRKAEINKNLLLPPSSNDNNQKNISKTDNFNKTQIQEISEKKEVTVSSSSSSNDLLYGPKLPPNIKIDKSKRNDDNKINLISSDSSSNDRLGDIDKKLLKILKKKKKKKIIEEKWIEKSSDIVEDKKKKKKKDKKKKSKKHKKEKKSKK